MISSEKSTKEIPEEPVDQDALKKQQQTEQINILREGIKALHEQIHDMQETLKDGGVQEKLELKKCLEYIKLREPKLFDYIKAFYWTVVCYFDFYQKKTSKVYLIPDLPELEKYIANIDEIIQTVVPLKKKEEERAKIINMIFMFNKDATILTDDDFHTSMTKTVLDIIKKKGDGLKAKAQEENKGNEHFENELFEFREKTKADGVTLYESFEGAWGLRDAVLLLAFIHKNHTEIIRKVKTPLNQQFEDIVVTGRGENLLKTSKKKSTCLCS